MRKRIINILAVSAVLGIVTFSLVRALAQDFTAVSFSAEVTQTLYKYPSGELGKTLTETYLRRSNGSYAKVRYRKSEDGSDYIVWGASNLATKLAFTADTQTRSVTSSSLSDEAIGLQKPSQCKVDASSESAVLLGYKVFKQTQTLPSSENRYQESWVAPELGCYVLKSVLYRQKQDQAIVPVTVLDVTKIKVGEPDPSFFDLPDGYTERTPGQVLALEHSLALECKKCKKNAGELFDESYAAHRRR